MEYFALSSNLSPICHVIIIRLYILLNIYLFIHIQYNIYDIFETKRKKNKLESLIILHQPSSSS